LDRLLGDRRAALADKKETIRLQPLDDEVSAKFPHPRNTQAIDAAQNAGWSIFPCAPPGEKIKPPP